MKCDKCFFCAHIGIGIYGDYPVKYCRHRRTYKVPVTYTKEEKDGMEIMTPRRLNFNDIKDCKIWHEVGCRIHPSTVAKAKRDFIKKCESEVGNDK